MQRLIAMLVMVVVLVSMTGAVGMADGIPVIFDTDIGSDIDDTWALALLLCSPEFDLKLVVTDSHDTTARAKIVAKFLEKVRRTDVAVGIGVKTVDKKVPQAEWAKEYDLTHYPGKIYEDGIQAMIDVINQSPSPVHLIVVGPCPNIPVLLQRAPEIITKVKVFAMSGSVKKGYNNMPSPDAEYNVREDIPGSKAMFNAGWDLTITPLDTCGIVSIGGEQYQKLIQTEIPVIQMLLENYKVWVKENRQTIDPNVRSTVLFDTVAVYLALQNDFCKMEDLRLKVDDKGFTVIDPMARVVHTAMEWKNLEGYIHWLAGRLQQGVYRKPKNP